MELLEKKINQKLNPSMYRILLTLSLAILPFCCTQLFAQPSNDNCLGAIVLGDVSNWCSDPGEFSNANATPAAIVPFCFPSSTHDVWFRFTAVATDVYITVVGNTGNNPGGTLENPQFAIYSGNCGNLTELQCASDGFGFNIAESFAGPLVPGETYYIQVDARDGNVGSFQLCVNNFNQVPAASSDCPTGVILCDKSSFNVESVVGPGLLTNEIDPNSCIQLEISSAWYKWTCDEPGTLTFTLTPNNPSDDLDFAVYEMPNGIDDCSDLLELRCMASGENVGDPFSVWEPCTGPTGLDLASTDLVEFAGCAQGDDNFVAAITMETGKSYALVVNNFSNTGSGFAVDFGGTGTFLGPEPGFTVDPELGNQCDIDMVTFTDASTLPPGIMGAYEWFFGSGANPPVATGVGPHEVVYESFGSKSILLRITTEEGCIVTEVTEIYIEPCCDPANDLMIGLDDTSDPPCFGEETGTVAVSGSGGNPDYQFSIDGEDFQPIGQFINLGSGTYTVYIQDIKGCLDSLDASLFDPPELIVDAGDDQTINLGYTADLDALVIPGGTQDTIYWTFPELLSCDDCLDPTAAPPTTTTFQITVENAVGCTDADSVTVIVLPLRPIYIPNAFTPNFDGANDYFTAYGGAAAVQIKTLQVYDRWGNLVFAADNIPLGDELLGWDGTFGGQTMGSAVFAYLIEVEFIDGLIALYKGDLTLIR